ncbi:MAG: DUF4080 domain-containing protein [Spirochaetes bacterium]|jgi:hypothetical protein|nr:DUF4080 domain-containing protein [Spirochaetota bacterium]
MEKLLLVALNARYSHSNPALYYLQHFVIKSNHYEASIFETSINMPFLSIVESCLSSKASIVCFSVYVWNCELVKRLVADLLVVKPSLKIVLGGPEIQYNLSAWHECGAVLVSGGEASFEAALADRFSRPFYKETDRPFDDVPFPYFENQIALLADKYVYYESSRGCPFSCSFCLSSAQKGVSYRSLDRVKSELLLLIEHNVKIVKFVDRTFNSNPHRAREIWKFLLANRSSTLFHFEIDARMLEEEDFHFLETVPAGLFQFEIGVQSASVPTLREINRNTDIEGVLSALQRLSKIKSVHCHADIIAGLPFETLNLFGRSFDRVYLSGADHIQVGFLKVLPGTAMAKNSTCYETLCSQFPPYEIYSNRWMSAENLMLLRHIGRLVESIHNSGRMDTFSRYISCNLISPFAFYMSLASYARSVNFDFSSTTFEAVSQLILNYFQNFSENFFSGGASLVRSRVVTDFFTTHPSDNMVFSRLNKTFGIGSDAVRDILVFDYLRSGKALRIPSLFGEYQSKELRSKFLNLVSEKSGEAFRRKISRKIVFFPVKSVEAITFLGVRRGCCLVFCNGSAPDLFCPNSFVVISRNTGV